MLFSKYHGCGNDFILGVYKDNIDYSKIALKVCERHSGLGADGLILVKGNSPYEMVFYNADGTRGLMCGNGIRCFCAFLLDNNLENSDNITVKTLSGNRNIKIENNLYIVNMGKPDYRTKTLDINSKKDRFINEKIEYNNKEYICNAVFITTHHLVIIVDDLNISDDVGQFFCINPIFQKGINVNFVKIIDKKNIIVRTYERGVGWTKACGSGSCASVAVLNKIGMCDECVDINLEYGVINININDGQIFMKGPAELIASKIEYKI